MSRALPFTPAPDGLRLAVRVVPKSASDRILGLTEEAGGALALKVAVHAAPEGGKANEALLRLMAKKLRLPRRDLTLVLGALDRRKLIHIAGAPASLADRLEAELKPWLTQQ